MKIAATIARYLLGVMFLIFGSNMFFHFIPNPPMPPGPMANFSVPCGIALQHCGGMCQVIPAILLLINRYVAAGADGAGGEIVNISPFTSRCSWRGCRWRWWLRFLWLLVFLRVKSSFAGIFEPTPQREFAGCASIRASCTYNGKR